MESYKLLLEGNKQWVAKQLQLQPDFYEITSREQKPEFLWIGCSDSRVPAEEITGVMPGEIFVHRNIANMVIHTDFNMLSVLQFAVEVLKVKHIIVCGHYGCGGVKTAMTRKHYGLINKWLRHIKDVYRVHQQELESISDETQRYEKLVEFNVVEQTQHIAETSFVQYAWMKENRPTIHGWVYDIHSGYLRDLIRIDPNTFHNDLYRYDFSDE